MVGFEGKELHDRLFYGLEGLFSSWTAFQMAIQGEWGGSETAQKREWFIESMADYLYDGTTFYPCLSSCFLHVCS